MPILPPLPALPPLPVGPPPTGLVALPPEARLPPPPSVIGPLWMVASFATPPQAASASEVATSVAYVLIASDVSSTHASSAAALFRLPHRCVAQLCRASAQDRDRVAGEAHLEELAGRLNLVARRAEHFDRLRIDQTPAVGRYVVIANDAVSVGLPSAVCDALLQ